MSFGTSFRSTHQGGAGKPVTFWQQQAMETNKRKPAKSNKFVKEQKFPLRGKTETAAPVLQKPAPQKPANRRGLNPKTTRGKETDITPGVVTLTQAQLDAILSTVGTLVTQNEKLQDSHNLKDLQDLNKDEVFNVNDEPSDSPENILNLANASTREQKRPSDSPHGQDRTNRNPRVVEPDEIPGLGVINSDARVVAPASVPGLGSVDPPPAPSAVSKAHMTKAELKRLQWEQEREGGFSKGYQSSPLAGVGSRKPPHRLVELKPATPRAHLTKAERRRRESEDDRNMPVSPGRTLTDFWSNDPPKITSPSVNDEPPGIPRAHLTKAEIKRRQWEQERADIAARAAMTKATGYEAKSPNYHETPTTVAQLPPAGPGVPKAHLSKAELKRLQWEKERAEEQSGGQKWLGSEQQTNNKQLQQQSPSSPFVQKPGMSKTELKRLQWQKEREEQQAEEQAAGQKWLGNEQHTYNRQPQQQSPSAPFVHKPGMSKTEIKRLQWEKEREQQQAEDKAAGQKWLGSEQLTYNRQPQQQSPSAPFVPKPGMSKTEIKRLQWEKEREQQQAEQQQEFNPWGRPGAGAPIRDLSGNILTDYNQRKVSSNKEREEYAPPPQAQPLQSLWRY